MDKDKLRDIYKKQVEQEKKQDGPEWHAMEEAESGEQAQALKRKWEELALDVALLPEMNVRLVPSEKGERVEISDTMYEYFFSR